MATAKEDKPMWEYYALTLNVDRLVGGIPKHPNIVKKWQEAHLKGKPGEPTAEEATDATLNLLGSQAMDAEEVIQGIWTGFVTDKDDNLALENRNIVAMLKESANIVRVLPAAMPKPKRDGSPASPIPLKARLAERVYVHPRVITLQHEDKPVTEPESVERPIHVMTAQGPRTALKRTDYVDEVKLVTVLKVLNDGLITEKILRLILDHASENGLGTDRSQGNGTFHYTLEAIDQPDWL